MISPGRLAEIRARHQRMTVRGFNYTREACFCGEDWPCSSGEAVLLAEVDRLTAELARVEGEWDDSKRELERRGQAVADAMGRYRGHEPLLEAIARLVREYHEALAENARSLAANAACADAADAKISNLQRRLIAAAKALVAERLERAVLQRALHWATEAAEGTEFPLHRDGCPYDSDLAERHERGDADPPSPDCTCPNGHKAAYWKWMLDARPAHASPSAAGMTEKISEATPETTGASSPAGPLAT